MSPRIVYTTAEIVAKLDALAAVLARLEGKMVTRDEFLAKIAEANASLLNIRADIDAIKARLEGGLTAEDAAAVMSDLTALSDRLAVLDLENPAPEPPAEG